jgi:hypothetical protein
MLNLKTPKGRVVFYTWINKSLNSHFVQREIDFLMRNISLKDMVVIGKLSNVDTVLPEQAYPLLFWFYSLTIFPTKGNIYQALKLRKELFTTDFVKNSDEVIKQLNSLLPLMEIEPHKFELKDLNSALGLSALLN